MALVGLALLFERRVPVVDPAPTPEDADTTLS
jgi:hypothetical protein